MLMDPDIDSLIEHLNYAKHISVPMKNDDTCGYLYLHGSSWVNVVCYVIQFLSDSEEHSIIAKIISHLSDLLVLYKMSRDMQIEQIYELLVYDFMPQVQKFFVVPSNLSHQEDEKSLLNRTEVLAVFINFLLQILSSEANKYESWRGDLDLRYTDFYIQNSEAYRDEEQRYSFLYTEFKYLLTFFGDIPFQCTQNEDLKILLSEFEIVANQAGSLIFNYVLATNTVRFKEFVASCDTLLQNLDLLNAKIKLYCIKFSEFPIYLARKVTMAIDSISIVDSFIEDIENILNRRFQVTIDDMEDQMIILHKELKLSRTFLKNKKVYGEIENDEIKKCFITIRDIAYEAEYLTNSYLVGNIPIWYLRLRLPTVIQKVKLNGSKIQEIKKESEVLPVTTNVNGEISDGRTITSTTFVEQLQVKIHVEIKANILGDLVGSEKSLQIISLIGVSGLGKASVANNLFDDMLVNYHFDRRVWCVVSRTCDKRKLLLDILRSLGKHAAYNYPEVLEESMGKEIHKLLKGNAYIIFIVDWNPSVWDGIKGYFPDNKKGSRILLTTGIGYSTPNGSICHKLPLLSEVECVDLLVRKVFINDPCPPGLLWLGKRIAKKCNGLPLVVVAIAGILANLDKQESVWEKVENHLASFTSDAQGECMKILEFSYECLPDHLKLCYLYLVTCMEDMKIPIQEIIWLWVAEGFVQRDDNKTPEDVSNEYLCELINRSLVLVTKRKSNGDIKAYRIHNLLRDICLQKANEESFLKSTNYLSMYERHHRLRIYCTPPVLAGHFGLHCRSFLGYTPASTSNFQQMPLLRVMKIMSSDDCSNKLKGIDLLVYLRYLSLSKIYFWNLNQKMYQTVANLVNLEYLLVDNYGTQVLPSSILKMEKLRHIKIKEQLKFENDFDSCLTTNLKSLAYFCIDNLKDADILKCSPHLHILKCICSFSIFPDLRFLIELESLTMVFNLPYDWVKVKVTNINIPFTIKKLILRNIGSNQEVVEILGRLPNLEILKLFGEIFVGGEWETKDGEFQKLRFLKLCSSFNLREWITCSEHFPQLHHLVLQNCHQLIEIPCDLSNITTLRTFEVNNCSKKVSMSAFQIEEEQREKGNEELKFIIINNYWSKEQFFREHKEDQVSYAMEFLDLFDEGETT